MLQLVKRVSKYKSEFKCYFCNQLYITGHYDAYKSRIGHMCKECKELPKQPLTQDLVRKLFNYNKRLGKLYYLMPTHNHNVGDVAGYRHSGGYISISIGNTEHLAHRIIWLYVKGYLPDMVDHIDHVRTNNAWANLREVNNTDNSKNTSISSNSTTKVNGVSFMKTKNKYRAYIMVNRKQISLGLYTNLEDAIEARRKADIKYGFHSNHGR